MIADYVVTGNATKTAALHNIPRQTIDGWIKSDWGVELVGEIRHEKSEELDANLTKLIDAAFEQSQDRVENGDYRLTKDGKLIRVPMGGYQLVISGATAYDKRQLHRNQPTAISDNSGGTQALIKKFDDLANKWDEKQARVVSVQENDDE